MVDKLELVMSVDNQGSATVSNFTRGVNQASQTLEQRSVSLLDKVGTSVQCFGGDVQSAT